MIKKILPLLLVLAFVSKGFSQALTGIKTIGPSVSYNYTTISAAVADLNSKGISGNVIFSIDPSTAYTENFVINSFPAGANDTVFFRSSNTDSVKVNFTSTTNATNYIVGFQDAKNIVFDNFSFTANGTTYATIVNFFGSCKNIIFKNNRFNAAVIHTFDMNHDLCLSYSAGTHKSICFENNIFNGGNAAIQMNGSSQYNVGLTIRNNVFQNHFAQSLKIFRVKNLNIADNKIFDNEYTSVQNVEISNADSAVVIKGNYFDQTVAAYPVIIVNCNPTNSADYMLFLNNRFRSSVSAFGSVGFTNTSNVKMFHNTFFCSTSSTSITFGTTFKNYIIKNNLFVNTNPGGKIFSAYAVNDTTSDINNNGFYYINNFGYNSQQSIIYNDLSDWQAQYNTDAKSVEFKTGYNASWFTSDLHITCNLPKQFRSAVDLGNSSPLDTDGDPRKIFPSWVGADELVHNIINTANLTGTVISGTDTIKAGKVILYSDATQKTMLDALNSTTISNTGTFSFSNIPSRDYVLLAIPDSVMYPTKIRTYYGGKFNWNTFVPASADTCDNALNLVFEVDSLTSLATGSGSISGSVFYDGSLKNNDPIPGLDIVLDKVPPTKSVQKTKTDAYGHYVFNNIPNGDYRIKIDFPGLNNDSLYLVTVNNNAVKAGLDYCVDTNKTTAICGAASVVSEIKSATTKIVLAPNPVHDELNVVVNGSNPSNYSIAITDISGRTIVLYENVAGGNTIIQTSTFESGLYFVKVYGEGINETRKMMKQ